MMFRKTTPPPKDTKQQADTITAIPSLYRGLSPHMMHLSDKMLTVLGGLLPGFSALPDPMHNPASHIRGEFVGYDGITNKGHYDHLLISEWALQSLYPEEFVRRFAEGEALYTKREFRQRGDKTIVTALISCGPQMLGHGRLLALAALFHLAWLVQKRQAQLFWCPMVLTGKDNAYQWFEGLSRNSLKLLLTRASTSEPDAEDIVQANQLFHRLFAEEVTEAEQQFSWTIAPNSDLFGNRPPLLEHGEYALGFEPQEDSDPQRPLMELSQWRHSRRLSVRALQMPESDVCLAAMRRPMSPKVRSSQADKLVHEIGEQSVLTNHWEPQFFTFAQRYLAVLRVKDGLLVLTRNGRWQRFVPLASEETLVGISLVKKALRYLVMTSDENGDRLTLKNALWTDGGDGYELSDYFSVSVTSAHLFKRYSAFSIPLLTSCSRDHVEFYSFSGGGYKLIVPSDQRGGVTFKPSYTQGNVISSDGLDLVSLSDKNLKNKSITCTDVLNRETQYSFPYQDILELPDSRKKRATMLSRNKSQLAVSLRNKHWVIYSTAYLPVEIELAAHDMPLRFDRSEGQGTVTVLVKNALANSGDGEFEIVTIDVSDGVVSRATLCPSAVNSGGDKPNQYAHMRLDPRNGWVWGVTLTEDGDDIASFEYLCSADRNSIGKQRTSFDIAAIMERYR